ncbi:MAG: heme o synthase [Gammaproteobacteria bacterium]|jgi:protoheme IX farnesyltransferase|nr:heme o synthase [Gammaproteobacteria bacterium]
MTETLKLFYSTAKVRLGFLIMLCALAGFAVTPGGDLSPWQVLVLGVTVLLCSAGAGAFNQWYERDIDSHMRRTKTRAFVTGRFAASIYWPGMILLVSTLAILALALVTNFMAAFYLFLGAFCYGVVYTVWLKRRTWWNVVIGGAAGSFAVLAGAAAVDVNLGPAAIIMALVLFLWTPPHFWALAFACKRDYEKAGVPMLPVLVDDRTATLTILAHAVVLVALSLLPAFYGLSWIYLAGALSGGVYFIRESWRLHLKPSIPQAWRAFAASIAQLGLMLVTAIVDRIVLG